jgi:hypothetical protein
MKCFACGKENDNMSLNINVDRLIGVVQESFDNEASYRLECKKKPYWRRSLEEKENVMWHERNCHNSSSAVGDLAAILNIDGEKLNAIARLARKWEQKRKWQYCFPAQNNAKKIIEWLTAPDKSFTSEINYIHWKINKSGEKFRVILTDGSKIVSSKFVFEKELQELNNKAKIATDGNWVWLKVS